MAIYFVQPTAGGPIKIGTSENVDVRIKQLEAHYGQPLAVLATLPGGRDEERAIHERFSSLRFGKTEQFRPDPALLAFIGRPLFVSAGPVVEAMEARQPKRNDITVKVDVEVIDECRIAAVHKGMTLAEYLSETMRAAAARDIDEAMARRAAAAKKPPRR